LRGSLPLHWTLRLACVGCFVGHGAFGLMQKPAWLPYFHGFGFGDRTGLALMPVVGTVDILVAVITLVWPRRAVLLWMTAWAAFTALLRPLAGESWWEVIERAGNYGPPLALLVLSGWPRASREWWAAITPGDAARVPSGRIDAVATVLRVATGLLLIGHGGFGTFMRKAVLERHYAAAGLSALPVGVGTLARAIGGFEIVLGLFALAWPLAPLLLLIVAWKVATELLYPISGAPFWEFVERAGSYGVPLGLYWMVARPDARPPAPRPGAVPAESPR
jgi:hypothetical protein